MQEVKNLKHKGLVGISINDLAKQLNNFGESEGIQVTHTQTHVFDGRFYAIVFYKEIEIKEGFREREMNFNVISKEKAEEIKKEQPEKKPNGSSTIGCLWTRKKTLKGNLNNNPVEISHEDFKAMPETTSAKGTVMKIGEIEGVKVKVIPNSFKTEPKHPDYVIYAGGE